MKLIEIKVDKDMKELLDHKTMDLPMQIYVDKYDEFVLRYANWHWHYEPEYAVMLKGRAEFFAEDKTFLLEKGEAAFINARVLHQIKPVTTPVDTVLLTIVFHPKLLASTEQGNIFSKYVQPVILNDAFPYLKLNASIVWQNAIIKELYDMKERDDNKVLGYELQQAVSLLKSWYLIVQNVPGCLELNSGYGRRKTGQERMNKMMIYMKEHFAEELSIQEIAGAANISKSECYRCFQKYIGVKPFEFLLTYRIEQAIEQMTETDKKIAEIAVACGFNSTSYFSEVFKKQVGMTPREFRKNAGD